MITKLFKIAVVCILILTTSFFSFSQKEENLDIQPLSNYLIKTNFRLPFTRSNEFLKNVSNGVVDLQGSFNYSFIKNVYVGLGYRYASFKLSERELNSAVQNQLKGKIEQKGVYGELSYFYDVYENFSIEANFQVGMENTIGNSVICIANGSRTSKKGIFYAPNLNFYLKTEEVFSFFFSVGYNFSNTNFTPETVCVESFTNFIQEDYQGNYRHLNVGFGIGISLIKPRP